MKSMRTPVVDVLLAEIDVMQARVPPPPPAMSELSPVDVKVSTPWIAVLSAAYGTMVPLTGCVTPEPSTFSAVIDAMPWTVMTSELAVPAVPSAGCFVEVAANAGKGRAAALMGCVTADPSTFRAPAAETDATFVPPVSMSLVFCDPLVRVASRAAPEGSGRAAALMAKVPEPALAVTVPLTGTGVARSSVSVRGPEAVTVPETVTEPLTGWVAGKLLTATVPETGTGVARSSVSVRGPVTSWVAGKFEISIGVSIETSAVTDNGSPSAVVKSPNMIPAV